MRGIQSKVLLVLRTLKVWIMDFSRKAALDMVASRPVLDYIELFLKFDPV